MRRLYAVAGVAAVAALLLFSRPGFFSSPEAPGAADQQGRHI
jgi:hypothetical protein